MHTKLPPGLMVFDCNDELVLAQMKRRVDEALATLSLEEVRLLVEEIETQLGFKEDDRGA